MASSSLPVYDVVLSRSGKDADDFSYLLCKSLTSKGIRVLRGEEGQEVEGDTTTTSEELTIKESIRSAIVILSGNYASSPRLLEELSQILERKKVSGISVFPVFYDVKPSDVGEQTGVFGKNFNKNVQVFKEDPEKVLRWKIALKEVSKLIGWSSEHRNQIEIIKEIVNSVVRIRDGRNEIVRVRRDLTKSTDDNSVKNLPDKELVLDLLGMCFRAFSKFITPGLNLKDIRKLSLDGCKLRNISPLGQLSNLQELSLSQLIYTLPTLSNLQLLCVYDEPSWTLFGLPELIVDQSNTEDFELLNHLQLQINADFTVIIYRTADIIEQPGDVEGEINDHEDREGRPGIVVIHVNDHEDRDGATDATSSADWTFLLNAFVLEIFSAGFDQASSPRKPHYALIAMLLAIAAVLACTGELIHKGSLVVKRCQKLRWFYYLHPSNTLFGSLPDIFGLVSSISQCVFSTVQYIYFSHHVDSPIKVSLLLPSFLCVWLVQC